MFKNEYGEAAVEVLDILDNTDKEDVKKIPYSFIKFLVDNASEDYKVNLDHSKPICELNIKEKTKEILGTIYINWWCDNNQKEKFKKLIEEQEKRNREETRKKYNPNNLFEGKKRMETSDIVKEKAKQENTNLIIASKSENIFKKIINRIISFFKKKNGRG